MTTCPVPQPTDAEPKMKIPSRRRRAPLAPPALTTLTISELADRLSDAGLTLAWCIGGETCGEKR